MTKGGYYWSLTLRQYSAKIPHYVRNDKAKGKTGRKEAGKRKVVVPEPTHHSSFTTYPSAWFGAPDI
jgi:hypothetical protein